MTTRTELRSRIRAELGDETLGAYVWSDALLDSYISSAISRYSVDSPKQLTADILTVTGESEYSVPADCLRITGIEYPAGKQVLRSSPAGGVTTGWIETTWYEYGGKLAINPAPGVSGETIHVRYLGEYAAPDADDDVLEVPARDEEMIVWLVCEAALAWLNKQKDKRLDRRAGFLYPTTYASRYHEAMRARRRMRGVIGRRM